MKGVALILLSSCMVAMLSLEITLGIKSTTEGQAWPTVCCIWILSLFITSLSYAEEEMNLKLEKAKI